MEEDFSIQFSSLYLPMKYLAIILGHPVYVEREREREREREIICFVYCLKVTL